MSLLNTNPPSAAAALGGFVLLPNTDHPGVSTMPSRLPFLVALVLLVAPIGSAHAAELHLTTDIEGLLGGQGGGYTLVPSVGFVPAVMSCSKGVCLGGALPIRSVDWGSGDVTILMPSARFALDGLFTANEEGTGLGGYAGIDLGYVLSVGGDATVAGLGFGAFAGLRYWFTPTVGASVGVGAGGSPYAPVMQFPILSGGMTFAL